MNFSYCTSSLVGKAEISVSCSLGDSDLIEQVSEQYPPLSAAIVEALLTIQQDPYDEVLPYLGGILLTQEGKNLLWIKNSSKNRVNDVLRIDLPGWGKWRKGAIVLGAIVALGAVLYFSSREGYFKR